MNIYGITEDEDRFYIVTEELKCDERVELQEAVLLAGKFSEKNAACLAKEILESMNYCHENSLYHGFLRPDNILVTKNSDFTDIRIINFPCSLTYDENIQLNEKFQSPHFLAPEMLSKKGSVVEKSDGWSCGAIIYLLLSGQVPFRGDTDMEIIAKIKAGNLMFEGDIWDSVSDNAKDLISKLMTVDIDHRIDIEEALEHPWIEEA